jgi:hypothetical protein
MFGRLTPTKDNDNDDKPATTLERNVHSFIHSLITAIYYCENARILYSAFSSGNGDIGTCWNRGSK